MKRILLTTLLLLTLAHAAEAQQPARRVVYGSSLPATCNPNTGDIYFKTGVSPREVYFCSATNTWTKFATGSSYTDEQAQDAVGAMVDSTLVYTDATPLLSRAALTGDVTAPVGSNSTTLASIISAGSCTLCSVTFDAKGRATGYSSGSAATANSTTGTIPYLSTANTYSDSPLTRVDANTVEQSNGTNAQTTLLYGRKVNTSSDYYRLSTTWDGVTNFEWKYDAQKGSGNANTPRHTWLINTARKLSLSSAALEPVGTMTLGSVGAEWNQILASQLNLDTGTKLLQLSNLQLTGDASGGVIKTNNSGFTNAFGVRNSGFIANASGNYKYGFSQSGVASNDTALDSPSAGLVEVNNGTRGTYRDLALRKVFYSGTSVSDSSGSGSPEGVTTASIGSTYRRTDGSTATTLYVKESGSGNTGWAAVPNAAYMPVFARVTGSNATTTSTTLVDVTGLSVALAANSIYEFTASLTGNGADANGVKFGVNFSAAGATVEAGVLADVAGTGTRTRRINALNSATAQAFFTSANDVAALITGIITTGANAGNLTVQHLKVTSGTSTIYIGSYLRVTKIP